MDQTEKDLVYRLQKQKTAPAAFKALMHTYQRPLYTHIRTILGNHPDTDDALQNTFVKVYRNIGSFKGESALYTWLYRIATNEALSILRTRKRHSADSLDGIQTAATTTDGPSGDAIRAKLDEALASLPEKQRLVFELKYLDELKYHEISKLTGTTVGALKASYFHAVKKIEAFLTR